MSQFLDRFAFKNPKKLNDKKPDSLVQAIHNKQYVPHGSRGKSVQQLTASNCTEDESFIFAYLDKKRERRAAFENEDEDRMSVDDDEFEAYLDGLAGRKKNKKGEDPDDDFDLDFLADLEGDEQARKSKKDKQKGNDDADDDWDSDGAGGSDDNDECVFFSQYCLLI